MQYIIAISLLFAPAYAIRFHLFSIPTNILMMWLFLVIVLFAVKTTIQKDWKYFFEWLKTQHTPILILVLLFLSAGFISLFINGLTREKIGEFIVLFLQPLSLFFITGYSIHKDKTTQNILVHTLYIVVGILGAIAIIQYFTLFLLPVLYWGNSVEPKRAVSLFTHPNFFALFITPILAFLIPHLFIKKSILKTTCWILGCIGLILSLSRAGWIGLSVAVIAYACISAEKKIRNYILLTLCVVVCIVFITPNLRYRILLPFYGEKSAVSRISLWNTGVRAIQGSPIFGLGLHGFSTNWNKLNTDPNLDSHNFPHNIFLNFWVETGLLGLISIASIIFYLLSNGIKNKENIFKISLSLFLLSLIIQGQIDNPYFKNDLALLFWTLLSLGI